MIAKERNFYECQVELFLQRVSLRIYEREVPFTAAYAPSAKSVPFSQRKKASLKPIQEGEIWGRTWDSAWFHLTGTVPEQWQGKRVVARFNFGGEGCVFGNDGTPLQGLTNGSFFHQSFERERFLLFASCRGGETVELWVETAANNLFGIKRPLNPKPEDPSRFGAYEARAEKMSLAVFDFDLWHLLLDAHALFSQMQALPEDSVRRARLLRALTSAANAFSDGARGIENSRNILRSEFDKNSSFSDLSTPAVGHAHIDTAWLWPVRETIRKCGRTFSSQVRLLDTYPDYVFGASQPQLYQFTKTHYPALYEKIKQYVTTGRWELQGAMWVEADCNVPSGESLIRQIIHGKNFYLKEFGVEVNNLWLPDVFGYTASLPQILRKSGVDFFLTQKISWSQFNKFPHHTFKWQGIDGTTVITHFPPEDTYNSTLEPASLLKARKNFLEKGYLDEFVTLFGVGDGGGGPKEEHIEYGIRQKDLEGSPRVVFSRAGDFFERLQQQEDELITWSGELYLELHRGTLTTQARTKKMNRFLEYRFREVEFLASCLPIDEYPLDTLDTLWKRLLINQFHDILPGSSIHEVYDDTLRELTGVKNQLALLIKQISQALFPIRKDTLCLVNTLSWRFDDPVVLPKSWKKCTVVDYNGREIPSQVEDGRTVILPLVDSLSAITVILDDPLGDSQNQSSGADTRDSTLSTPVQEEPYATQSTEETAIETPLTLENDLILYEFAQDGKLTSAYDKQCDRQILSFPESGNVLSLYYDRPNKFDAWDVDIFYEQNLLEHAHCISRRRIADGPVRCGLHFSYTIGVSEIEQDVYLSSNSKRLDFFTEVDWRERRNMLRVSFAVDIQTTVAGFDIQFGYIKRNTHRNTTWDMAKFECAAHRFADLSDEGYGAALLNDCKYGYKVYKNVLDLNLLRSPMEPDPDADLGAHQFTYSFLPHQGRLTDSNVFAEAAKLNQRILLFEGMDGTDFQFPCTFESNDVVFETLKKAENEQGLIVRAYETKGRVSRAVLWLREDVSAVWETDIMERKQQGIPAKGGSVTLTFKPFEIRTFYISI